MKNKKSIPILIPFLILVSTLFIGILIFAYVETKRANPKMIEVGHNRLLWRSLSGCHAPFPGGMSSRPS